MMPAIFTVKQLALTVRLQDLSHTDHRPKHTTTQNHILTKKRRQALIISYSYDTHLVLVGSISCTFSQHKTHLLSTNKPNPKKQFVVNNQIVISAIISKQWAFHLKHLSPLQVLHLRVAVLLSIATIRHRNQCLWQS